jgi:hypothetical protein
MLRTAINIEDFRVGSPPCSSMPRDTQNDRLEIRYYILLSYALEVKRLILLA